LRVLSGFVVCAFEPPAFLEDDHLIPIETVKAFVPPEFSIVDSLQRLPSFSLAACPVEVVAPRI
jgi:hypothetical protein